MLPTLPASASGVAHPGYLSVKPGTQTPDILDGTVYALGRAGGAIIAGGQFTKVKDRTTGATLTRTNVVAFDEATGAVLPFNPALDGSVFAVAEGPDGSVLIAGDFTTVNTTPARIARLNPTDGSPVPTWTAPSLSGDIRALERLGSLVLVGGMFRTVTAANGTFQRKGLASLDAASGNVTADAAVAFVGQHNTGDLLAWAGVGVRAIAVSPGGQDVMVVGNFLQADGLDRDQVAKLRVTPTGMAVDAGWRTQAYTAQCGPLYPSYLRDVDYAPDGSFFAVATTGSGGLDPVNADGTRGNCDTAIRFETSAAGDNVPPTWIAHTGNDSLWSVAVTGQAVYVGGHQRWMNNDYGSDRSGAGSVPRPGLAALDPLNGQPLAWNPGRNPRGGGAYALLATPNGLYVGSDTSWIGNRKVRRERVAFFPTAAGTGQRTVNGVLPGKIVQAGTFGNAAPTVLHRVSLGGPAAASMDGGADWAADEGASSAYATTATTKQALNVVRLDGSVAADTPVDVLRTGILGGASTAPGAALKLDFPVPAGTQAEVRLFFNESTYTQAGKRVFDVLVEGQTVADDLDLIAAVGRDTPLMKSSTVTSDGTIDIDFTAVVGRPSIAAVEIVVPGTGPTDPAADGSTATSMTATGAITPIASPLPAAAWHSVRGAFVVNKTLYYAWTDGFIHKRPLSGQNVGADERLDPYNDPVWNDVITGSTTFGQTYRGLVPTFNVEDAQKLTSLVYSNGYIYYTLEGSTQMFSRAFTPDSGIVSGIERTVEDGRDWSDVAGGFIAGGRFYYVKASTGVLMSIAWDGSKAVGAEQVPERLAQLGRSRRLPVPQDPAVACAVMPDARWSARSA